MESKNKINFLVHKSQKSILIILIFIIFFVSMPEHVNANSGKILFKNHCAGCHLNGGNIIRRSKNLKISSLKRNGIDNPESIAKIVREGVGRMDSYIDKLGDNGDQVVANWVWEQAQKAWVQE